MVISYIYCNGMCGRYDKEIAEMFLKAYRQAIDWINEHGNMNIKY